MGRPSARKYPIIAKENYDGGDRIKLPAATVRDALAAGLSEDWEDEEDHMREEADALV